MIVVSLEKRDQTVLVRVRDTHKVQPFAEVRSLAFGVFEQFQKSWDAFYHTSEALMQHSGGSHFQEIETKLRRKGKALALLLFGRRIPSFDAGILVVSVDAALSRIPFELLHVGGRFLCMEVSILRELPSGGARPQAEPIPHIASALMLLDPSHSPQVRDSVGRERDELVRVFRKHPSITMKIIQSKPGSTVLFEEFLEARYLHYSGHHESGSGNDQSFLIPAELGAADLGHIEVAFVNACHSAVTRQHESGLADVLIKNGVRNFVGFGLPVETKRAERIASSFWRRKLAGEPVPEIIKAIRAEVRDEFGIGSFEWVSLQHFGTIERDIKRPIPHFKRALLVAAGLVAVASGIAAALYLREWIHPPALLPNEVANNDKKVAPPVPSRIPESRAPIRPAAPDTNPSNGNPQTPLPTALRAVFDSFPQAFEDEVLRKQVVSFYTDDHPVYSDFRKIEIIRETLNLDVSSGMKVVRLRSEMAKQR